MAERRNAWDQREKLIGQGRAQLAMTAAAALDNHIQLRKVQAGLAEQTEVLADVDRAIRAADRNSDRRHREMVTSVDAMHRTIAEGQEVASNQAYAQWRDGNEIGRLYHYTYRPKALRYLENYQRLSEVYRATILLELRKAQREYDESHTRPKNRNDDLAKPRHPGDTRPVEVPKERSKFLWAVIFFFVMVFAAGALVEIPIVGAFLSLLGIPLGMIGGPVLGYWLASKWNKENHDAALATNQLRKNAEAGYGREVRQWEEEREDNDREFRRELDSWNQHRTEYSVRSVGVDFDEHWVEGWATPRERRIHMAVAHIINTAQQNPPARDTLVSPGALVIDESLEPRHRRPLLRTVDQLSPV